MEHEVAVEEGYADKEATQEEEEDNLSGLMRAVRDPALGFEVRDRSYHLKTYPACFVGSEAVDWLVQNWGARSREEAVQLGQRLRAEGVFEHVKDITKPFLDGYYFYRFTEKKKVVIVGGGFAGSKVAKKLQAAFDVTLVDSKDHFVCLISLPSCVCDTAHLSKVTSRHSTYLHCKVVVDEVIDLRKHESAVVLKKGGVLPYDYLVLCTGSRYRMPVTSNEHILVVDPLVPAALQTYYEPLQMATSVTVIGGGPVGIEIAGEIAHYFPEKRLNIIYSGKKMLERCCKGAHSSVKNYFKAFPNVRIYADQKVVDTDQDCLVTDKGERIPTDVAYCCVGFVPNTDFMKANFAELLTPKGHIKVNEHLQTVDYPNIFALGDIADINEEKLAQNAEKHADVVAKNIRAMESTCPFAAMHSYTPGTRVLIISLGPKRAMLVRGDRVYIEGSLASKVKYLVEFRIMRGL